VPGLFLFRKPIMTTIQIKHRYTNAVLFECEAPEGVASGLHLRHALEKAAYSGAYLRGADLSGAYLRGANLSCANLSCANLSGANLSGANLSCADLSGANLSGADLRGADLRGANLSGADLSGANLRGANLSCADLRGADLSGANLSGANLSDGLKLSGNRPFFSVGPIGSRMDVLQAFTTDCGIRLKAGCFFGTLDEFRSKLIATHGISHHREEYESALVLIEKHAALWPATKTTTD
jgi:hypothetical protein